MNVPLCVQLVVDVDVVQMGVACAPNGQQQQQFFMPDPLCVPCLFVESGQGEEEEKEADTAEYNEQWVEACWREAHQQAWLAR